MHPKPGVVTDKTIKFKDVTTLKPLAEVDTAVSTSNPSFSNVTHFYT